MRRAIELQGVGTVLEVSRFTMLRGNALFERLERESPVSVGILHLDEYHDGTWLLTCSDDVVTDFTQVQGLTFHNLTNKKLQGASIILDGLATTLPLSKAVSVAPSKRVAPGDGPKSAFTGRMIHLDRNQDGSWLLLCSKEVVPDVGQLAGMAVIRED